MVVLLLEYNQLKSVIVVPKVCDVGSEMKIMKDQEVRKPETLAVQNWKIHLGYFLIPCGHLEFCYLPTQQRAL